MRARAAEPQIARVTLRVLEELSELEPVEAPAAATAKQRRQDARLSARQLAARRAQEVRARQHAVVTARRRAERWSRWSHWLLGELASALRVDAERLVVHAVRAAERQLDVDVLPVPRAPGATAHALAALPATVAAGLRAQLSSADSALRRSPLGARVDPAFAARVEAVAPSPALLDARRAALFTSADEGGTCACR